MNNQPTIIEAVVTRVDEAANMCYVRPKGGDSNMEAPISCKKGVLPNGDEVYNIPNVGADCLVLIEDIDVVESWYLSRCSSLQMVKVGASITIVA